jgi:hypothetical protein
MVVHPCGARLGAEAFPHRLSSLLAASMVVRLLSPLSLYGQVEGLVKPPVAAHEEALFHFSASHSVHECMDCLPLDEVHR